MAQKIVFSAAKVAEVKISTYWDAHGMEIPWEGRNKKKYEFVKNCDVKVVKTPYDSLALFVDGKQICGDVTEYGSNSNGLWFKVCVGAG